MTLYDLSGSVGGTGGASTTDAPLHDFGGTLLGVGVANATLYRIMIFSGMPQGVGMLSDGLLANVGGLVAGTSTVTGSILHIIGIGGKSYGHGNFNVSVPDRIFGIGNLSAFMDVVQFPLPICPQFCACERHFCEDCHDHHHREHYFQDCDVDRCKPWRDCTRCRSRHAGHRHEREHEHREEFEWTRHPNRNCRIFCWQQSFTKGDLEIFLRDRFGNPRAPVMIGYTMMQVSSTGIMHQVGPTDRAPATDDLGRYYVTGMAGENGQPGCWAVLWRYQRSFGERIVERIEQFKVLDHRHHPLDRTDRKCKIGWDL